MKHLALNLAMILLVSIGSNNAYSQCNSPSHNNNGYSITGFETFGANQNISNTNNGTNFPANYTDYGLVHEVRASPGSKFQIRVSTNNYWTRKGVWVDWNRDGDFSDTLEQITLFSGLPATPRSDSLTVPSTAAGTYNMRVRSRYYYSGNATPCGALAWGETEDYALTATVANDVAPSSLENDLYCVGSQSIKVNLRNVGSNSISSASIGGSIGTTTFNTFNFTGTLAAGDDTLLTLGTHSFTAGQVDTLVIYSYSPNGGTDANLTNDTLQLNIRPGMSGSYTIGGTSPDYTGFVAAFNAINNNGLCGDVTFNVRSGTYTESLIIDSYQNSDLYSITVQQDASNSTDPVIQNSARVLQLRGAQNLIWDSVNVKALGGNNAVYLFQNNQDITIKNSVIEGSNINGTSTNYSVIYEIAGTANYSSDISILSNEIKRGSHGIYALGTNTTTKDKGWRIEDNSIEDFYYMGIRMEYVDSAVIHNNYLEDKQVYNYCYGSYLRYSNFLEFSSNKIRIIDAIAPYGAYIQACQGSTVDSTEIKNNFIQVEESSTTYGLYHTSCNYSNVDFNTIRSSGAIGFTFSYSLYSNASTYSRYRNNLLVNESGGFSFALYLNQTTSTYINQCDFNNYYAPNGNLVNGSLTISDWQSTVSFDQNSISVDPEFRGALSSTPNNLALDSAGRHLADISTDINGSTRTNSPDIGCEEFSASTNDLSILEVYDESICPGSTPVKVRIKNAGSNSISSFSINWWVRTNSGTAQQQTAASFSFNLALDPQA